MFLKDFIEKIDDTVSVKATLQETIDKMTKDRLHHIVIVDENKPVGIITERDFVRFYKNKISFESLAIDHAIKSLIILNHSRLVEYALSMMMSNNIKKIIVTNNKKEYQGCIEQEDLLYFLEAKIQNQEVKLLELTHPGNKAVLVDENSTLSYALEIMTSNSLTSLLVTSNDKAVGIISESDIIRLAQSHMEHTHTVKEFMHTPIIQIEEYKTAKDMIELMQRKRIRRVVIFNTKDATYYTLTSKDIASSVQQNYTTFIESKFLDTRDTFNALSEYVIELVDIDGEQLVFWTNSITKANFDINLDDNITKIITKDIWEIIVKKLYESHIVFETVKIKDKYYQVKGHYGTLSDDRVIKLFLNDITHVMELTEQLQDEIKKKDELLFNQAKMVQMGEMIGNIAHQWRQPLSFISTASSGLKMQKEYNILEDSSLLKNLDEISNQAQYLSDTIDTFRNFMKENKEEKVVILQERIKMSLHIINTSLKNNHIKLIDKTDDLDPMRIKLILGELTQVIINIINNAKDAILENSIEEPWVKIELSRDENDAIITIENNGGPIPEDVMPHIFDPYFTTKDSTHGTGLGLDMSYKIITQSLKGKLYANNTTNGVKFYIILPLC
jgi:signal transduction histidine kinase/predicted transcriptional regulator